jgi:hypothetical protein
VSDNNNKEAKRDNILVLVALAGPICAGDDRNRYLPSYHVLCWFIYMRAPGF